MKVSGRLPAFSVVDRYILREFLRFYALALIGFTAFVLLFDGFEKIDTFIDYRASAGEVFRYYWYATPYKAILVAPIAPLLATFLCVGYMTRYREVIVLLTTGLSLYRIFAPIYLMGLVAAGGSFLITEFVMPRANLRAREVLDGEIKGRSLKNLGSRLKVTYLGEENRRIIIRRYDVPRETMVDLTIQEFDGDRLVRRVDAKKGVFESESWLLVEGIEREFEASGEERAVPFDSLWFELPERPEDFAKDAVDRREMSYTDLRKYTSRVRQSGSSAELYETELHFRVSFSFTYVIVILIASSLAVQLRRGGVALGFGLSLAITFIYWCAIRAGEVLGHAGSIPPLVAAWLANAVFLTLGIVLLVRTPK